MVNKPSILIGITQSGKPECILTSLDADEVKSAFIKERDNPSGKYKQILAFRKPPYWKRRELKDPEEISEDLDPETTEPIAPSEPEPEQPEESTEQASSEPEPDPEEKIASPETAEPEKDEKPKSSKKNGRKSKA